MQVATVGFVHSLNVSVAAAIILHRAAVVMAERTGCQRMFGDSSRGVEVAAGSGEGSSSGWQGCSIEGAVGAERDAVGVERDAVGAERDAVGEGRGEVDAVCEGRGEGVAVGGEDAGGEGVEGGEALEQQQQCASERHRQRALLEIYARTLSGQGWSLPHMVRSITSHGA